MPRVDVIISQLNLLSEKAKQSSKKTISEQECRSIYDQICAVFPNASADDRVDIQVAFEDRELLIEAMTGYMLRLAQQALRLGRRNKRDEAIQNLQQALIADVIIDGRTNVEELQKIQDELLNAAKEIKFDVEPYLQSLETSAADYVQRAYQLHKQQKRPQAIRALGRALQLDHTLRTNPKIGEFANLLTNEAPYSAIMTLEDSFTRNNFIHEMERKERIRQTQTAATVKESTQTGLLRRVITGVFPKDKS